MKAHYAAVLVLLGALAAAPAYSQGYPSKPVRVIEPHPAGSILDNLARAYTQVLSQALGQPFVIENRVGGDGIIGAEACARAAPDGYTLCITDSLVISVNPVIRARLPYDPRRDFAPVGQFGSLTSVLIVQPSLPVNSVSELVELARSKPGAITWGSWGLNSLSHLYIEWLKKVKGVSFYDVPYKGAIQAAQALLGGQVQVALWGVATVAPLAKSGKVKPLAVTGDTRIAIMPELPTFKEAGIDLVLRAWFGMFAPAGTPAAVVQRLNREIARAVSDAQFREKFLTSQGFAASPPVGGTPEQFAAFLATEREMYESVVKLTGVKEE